MPGDWDLTTEAGGVNPGRSNIRDASAVAQRGANTFLYLGFTREDSTGTTFLTFELNHDERLWNNGKARIPCRATGDVLISYEPLGNDVRRRAPALDDHRHRRRQRLRDERGCSRPSGSLAANDDAQGGDERRADHRAACRALTVRPCRRGASARRR